MAKLNKLNAKKVENLKEPGRYGDGGGLYLDIKTGGRRRWIFRYRDRRTGKLRDKGLGSAADVSLSLARDGAHAARLLLADGKDPIDDTGAARSNIPTFAEFAEEVIAALQQGWRNPKHRAQWRSSLKKHAGPIADMRVDDITTSDVLKVLSPIWNELSETADRVRGRIETILDAAKARGYRDGENPARRRGNLDHLLSSRKRLVRGHHAAMPYKDVPDFIARLRERPSMSALALEFTILTAARSGETRGATWDEVDVQQRLWTIPAERMGKTLKEHRVPLTDRCLEILTQVAKIRQSQLIFPGQKPLRPLSDMTLSSVLRRMGVENCTVHGFRSSFRDWAADVGRFPREIAEAALAHKVGDAAERAYRRGDALEPRRAMMEAWELYLNGVREAKVVPITAQRAVGRLTGRST